MFRPMGPSSGILFVKLQRWNAMIHCARVVVCMRDVPNCCSNCVVLRCMQEVKPERIIISGAEVMKQCSNKLT
jgi:hypothetical protein